MLDRQTIELIHAGIDSELGAEEREQLDALLESEPEARELHAELLRMSNFLDSLPKQKPPAELSGKILSQISLPRRSAAVSLRERFSNLQPLALGGAFAAGLMLTVGFYELSPGPVSTSDLNRMVGTALLDRDGPSEQLLGRLALDESWLSGSVTLEERGKLLILNFDLDSNSAVEVELGLVDAGLEFAGIAQESSGGRSAADELFQVSGGTVRVENRGRQSFAVFLRSAAQAKGGQEITIDFSSGERHASRKFSR